MGIFDAVEGMLGQHNEGSSNVAGGLMQALDEHPGGLGGVMQAFRQNGMGQHVDQWSQGQQTSASPEQIGQGLAGTGFVESVAAKAGVSPQVAQAAMATILPLVMAHFTGGGQQAPPQGGYSGMASQLLGKLL